MKKILVALLLVAVLLIFATPVFAGGGQQQGDIGQGATHENFENECDEQPCFIVAPQPQNKNRP